MRFKLAYLGSLLALASVPPACTMGFSDDGAVEGESMLDAGGSYAIVATASGLPVGVADASTSPGAAVVQLPSAGDASGTWTLESRGGNRYRIVNRNSAHCLSVRGAARTSGATLEQASCSDAGIQQWTLRLREGRGGYLVRNTQSGKCMSLASASAGAGSELRQAECSTAPNLFFRFDASNPSVDAGTSGPDASVSDAGGPVADAGAPSDASSQDASPPGPGTCSSTNLGGCMRGLYVSPYAERSGRNVFGGDTEMFRYLLGDAAKEEALLAFVRKHAITSIALYNLHIVLADPTQRTQLASLIARLRAAGVAHVDAIGAVTPSDWDRIADYHRTVTPFDGMLTEIEFWNGSATFESFLDNLRYMRSLGLRNAQGLSVKVSAYVGWFDQAQADQMVQALDRLYIHAYVKSGENTFGYAGPRMEMVAGANTRFGTKVDVWPIYSAEGEQVRAGEEIFEGEWLRANGLPAGERLFLTEYEKASFKPQVQVTGHQYYDYFYLDRHIEH